MPTLIIEHAPRSTVGMVGQVLREHGLRMRTIRVHQDEELPSDLDDVDGIISCGGPMSATDDSLPWIAHELALLKAAHDSSLPVLGLCLGSQLLARALGGTVKLMEGGPSVGMLQINLNPVGREDPLFRGLPWYGNWPSWHSDEVTELPTGATLLAKSEKCPIEAWHLGVFSYGLQFHPEWDLSMLTANCDDPTRFPPGANVDTAKFRATINEQAEAINRQSRRFSMNVATCFIQPDKINTGVNHDIIH
jgi:GMP synthase (glutamine-hydrolysing)